MLSNEEKKEMLEDGKSKRRRDSFSFAKNANIETISFDHYLLFLNNIQKLFNPFQISYQSTLTRLNKL